MNNFYVKGIYIKNIIVIKYKYRAIIAVFFLSKPMLKL